MLLWSRIVLFGTVAISFPVASVAVYGFGTDRQSTAAVLSVIYSVGILLALSTSLWPFPELRGWSRLRRIESLVLLYLGMSYVTHLTWELGWLVWRDAIAANPNEPWTYTWWAYIDGGDSRYANPTVHLTVMEILSVTHGLVGAVALTHYLRSGRRSVGAVLVFVVSAAVHLYSTSLYYLTELLDGMPNVDTESFIGTYIKFGLANSPWLVVPGFILWWAKQKLSGREGASASAGPRGAVGIRR